MIKTCTRCQIEKNDNQFVEDWTHCRKCTTKQEYLDYFQPDLTKWFQGIDAAGRSKIIKRIVKAHVAAALCVALTACTYSISMAHTEGVATDTIDDTQTATPTTTATLTGLPL
jgi:hypothetical protein